MTDSTFDMPPGQPDDARDVFDDIDDAVARITDAEIEDSLSEILHQAGYAAPTTTGSDCRKAAADGGIFNIDYARYSVSMDDHPLTGTGKSAYRPGGAYRPTAADDGMFTSGDAGFPGSTPGHQLTGTGKPAYRPGDAYRPAATYRPGDAYRPAAADGGGGMFAFGHPGFYGSIAGHPLTGTGTGKPADRDGNTYRLSSPDGGIFTSGDAGFHGSTPGHPLTGTGTGKPADRDGNTYRPSSPDGGIFTYGDARSPARSATAEPPAGPVPY